MATTTSRVLSLLCLALSGAAVAEPPGAPRIEHCADEGGRCAFDGQGTVFYGAEDTWATRTETGGVACTNAVFGDPLVGVRKACFVVRAYETSALPPASAGSLGDFAQQLLDTHNCLRAAHGVPPLQWHAPAADYAAAWVAANGFSHSSSYRSPIGPMGENLFWSSGGSPSSAAALSWYSEASQYRYGRERPAKGTGHFTAMIWKGARYLGCGHYDGVISCNYWSGTAASDCSVPNMGGCYAEQVPRPTSDPSACL